MSSYRSPYDPVWQTVMETYEEAEILQKHGGFDLARTMPRYRPTNCVTGAHIDVDAPLPETACKMVNWQPRDCRVEQLRDGSKSGSGKTVVIVLLLFA